MQHTYRGGIMINHGLCIACKKCHDICPTDIFHFNKKTKLMTVAYPEECWYCGACVYDCPVDGALTMEFPLACL